MKLFLLICILATTVGHKVSDHDESNQRILQLEQTFKQQMVEMKQEVSKSKEQMVEMEQQFRKAKQQMLELEAKVDQQQTKINTLEAGCECTVDSIFLLVRSMSKKY